MKKLLIIICLFLAFSGYSQTTRKYNDVMERFEFYNSNGQIVGYAKYDSIQERWEFFDSNNQMYAYSKYNSLTGETKYIELNKYNNSNGNSGRFIIHDYGEPSSNFNRELQMLASKYGSGSSGNFVKIGERREVKLNKHTLNFKLTYYGFSRKEIAYQLKTKSKSRLEVLAGVGSFDSYDTFRVLSNYQGVQNILGYLNLYGGLGIGYESVKQTRRNPYAFDDFSGSYFLGYGVFGVEYNLDIPLIIFIDFDVNYSFNLEYGAGIGLRYGFNF